MGGSFPSPTFLTNIGGSIGLISADIGDSNIPCAKAMADKQRINFTI
jgi:hypothetical protein